MCINYSNGKIFKLTSYQTPNIYIGGTVQKLSQKLAKFRKDYKLYIDTGKDIKYYHPAFKMFRYDNIKIVLMSPCSCNNKDELDGTIYEYIDNHECINKKLDKYETMHNNNKKKRGPNKKNITITETDQRTEQYIKPSKKNKQKGGHDDIYQNIAKANMTNRTIQGKYNFLNDTDTETDFIFTDTEAAPTQKPILKDSKYCKCGVIYKNKDEKIHLTSKIHLDNLKNINNFNGNFMSSPSTNNLTDLTTSSL